MEGDPWWNGHLVVVTEGDVRFSGPSRIAVLALGDGDVVAGGDDAVRDAVLAPIGTAFRDVDNHSYLYNWGSTSGWHELLVNTQADLITAGVVAALTKLWKDARAGRPDKRPLSREDAEARVVLYLGRAFQGNEDVRVTSAGEQDGAWEFRAEVADQVVEGTIDASGALLVAECRPLAP